MPPTKKEKDDTPLPPSAEEVKQEEGEEDTKPAPTAKPGAYASSAADAEKTLKTDDAVAANGEAVNGASTPGAHAATAEEDISKTLKGPDEISINNSKKTPKENSLPPAAVPQPGAHASTTSDTIKTLKTDDAASTISSAVAPGAHEASAEDAINSKTLKVDATAAAPGAHATSAASPDNAISLKTLKTDEAAVDETVAAAAVPGAQAGDAEDDATLKTLKSAAAVATGAVAVGVLADDAVAVPAPVGQPKDDALYGEGNPSDVPSVEDSKRILEGEAFAPMAPESSQMVESSGNKKPEQESAPNDEADNNNDIVSAMVVDEDELEAQYQAKILKDVVAADVVDADEFKEKGRVWKISLALCCILGIILAIAIPLSRNNDPEPDAPTASPTEQSEEDFLYDLFFPFSGNTLDDESTPQYRAMNWLLNEDPAMLPIKATNNTILMERYAAAVFYYSTNGDQWTLDFNFLSNSSICEWASENGEEGLACEGGDSPVRIDMSSNNLNGTLPSELQMFSRLASISLIVGGLHGTIPPAMGELSLLNFLQLPGHQLSGTLPDTLRNLDLQLLNLLSNNFSGTIPSDLFIDDDNLLVLVIGENNFEGPLPELNRQSAVEFVWVYDNLFSGPIPNSYTAQPQMKMLRLENNMLSGSIPEQIRALTSLGSLQGHGNFFTGSLPASISELSGLGELSFDGNNLNGTLPSQIGGMPSLGYFSMADNQLSGTIPVEFGNLGGLGVLDLSRNPLRGVVPSSLSQLGALGLLDISGTMIEDGLELAFCNQTSLITNVQADCADEKIPCSCCTSCCTNGENCEVNVNSVCEVRSSVYELAPDRETSCSCVEGGTRLSCSDDNCESCNLDRSVCAQSTDYGTTFDNVSGEVLSFNSTIEYTVGRNEILRYSFEIGDDECRLEVNGEECSFCGFNRCASDAIGYEITCANINGPTINTCQQQTTDAGYLEVFYLTDPSLLSGCPLVLNDY